MILTKSKDEYYIKDSTSIDNWSNKFKGFD